MLSRKNIIMIALAVGLLAASSDFAIASGATPLGLRKVNDTYQAAVFALIVNSPRANGMGGCSVNLVDEESAIYNPGALGLLHLKKTVAVSLPARTWWLPQFLGDIGYKTHAVSVGVSRHNLLPKSTGGPNLSLAVAWSKQRLGYGAMPIFEEGDLGPASTVEPYDQSQNVTISAGFEYYLRAGIGYTKKAIKEQLYTQGGYEATGKTTAHDYGILVELPIGEILNERLRAGTRTDQSFGFELTPSVGYVKGNIGDPIEFPDVAPDDSLARFSRFGRAVKLGLKIGNSSLASVLIVKETQKDLMERTPNIERKGYELGILGIVFIRDGEFDDGSGEYHTDTRGYGLSIAGAISWFRTLGKFDSKYDRLSRLIQNLDITLDHAEFSGDSESILANTDIVTMHFSF